MAVMITVNGAARTAADDVTVERVVGDVTALTSGVAAAVNGEVVPRRRWAGTVLRDGDRVEVVTAVQGG